MISEQPPVATSAEEALTPLRKLGTKILVVLFGLNIFALALTGLSVNSPHTFFATAIATGATILTGVLVFGLKRHGLSTRLIIATVTATLPALFVLVLSGTEWQMDLHMYFFPALAGLVVLLDRPTILLGTALIGLHHLVLSFVQPEWVFTGNGDLPRVFLHVVIVALQTGALLWIVTQLSGMIVRKAQAADAADALRIQETMRIEADRARSEAEAKRAQAEAELLRERDEQKQRGAQRRREMADKIEQQLGSIVTGLATMSVQLADSRNELRRTFSATTTNADAMRIAHDHVRDEVANFGEDARTLVSSIRDVGGFAAQTRETASRGAKATTDVLPQVQDLSATMEEARNVVKLISDVASQSRMLALNATIEATKQESSGFRVVASEMKNLAEQTARATTNISDMLDRLRTASQNVALSITGAAEQVTSIDGSARSIAMKVDEQIERTSLMSDVAQDLFRQVSGSAQNLRALTASVDQVDEVITQSEEVSRAISEQASELEKAMTEVLSGLRAA